MALLTHTESQSVHRLRERKRTGIRISRGVQKFSSPKRPDQVRCFPGTYRIEAAPLSAGVKREKSEVFHLH